MAEWLRRWTANPMCSARMGSNPMLVEIQYFSKLRLDSNISVTKTLHSDELIFEGSDEL